ncbi:hypothetical protein [Lederbergia panacisoli]|uniref:hypothetical protein n=1 Tax=Lederbergia panacisoli TaxID=1255251 RepID=UPI00214B0F32|nr:hypothetical protein [Lederbergia panacisoli]MCR2823793.1 hypothetical protein [Lederbergia panacisoli]
MNRVSIAPYEKVIKIYSESHHENDMDALNVIDETFEQGIFEAVKEIAYLNLLKDEEQLAKLNTPEEMASKEFDLVFKKAISLCDNKQQESSLFRVEESINKCSALSLEKYYIEGFIKGYIFVKTIHKGEI